jgi:hypothetical protein
MPRRTGPPVERRPNRAEAAVLPPPPEGTVEEFSVGGGAGILTATTANRDACLARARALVHLAETEMASGQITTMVAHRLNEAARVMVEYTRLHLRVLAETPKHHPTP